MKAFKLIGAFALAVLLTYFLAVIASTQSVLGSLAEMGVAVTLGQRLGTTYNDLVGMSGRFLPLIAVGLLIAFAVSGLLSRRLIGARTFLYALGGAVAIMAVHFGLEAAFGIVPIAGARSAGGLGLQAVAGAIGGLVFAKSTVSSTV